jgi:hypothetical protein
VRLDVRGSASSRDAVNVVYTALLNLDLLVGTEIVEVCAVTRNSNLKVTATLNFLHDVHDVH